MTTPLDKLAEIVAGKTPGVIDLNLGILDSLIAVARAAEKIPENTALTDDVRWRQVPQITLARLNDALVTLSAAIDKATK